MKSQFQKQVENFINLVKFFMMELVFSQFAHAQQQRKLFVRNFLVDVMFIVLSWTLLLRLTIGLLLPQLSAQKCCSIEIEVLSNFLLGSCFLSEKLDSCFCEDKIRSLPSYSQFSLDYLWLDYIIATAMLFQFPKCPLHWILSQQLHGVIKNLNDSLLRKS